MKPKNGMYLTNEDFLEWQDYFSKLVKSKNSKDIADRIVQNVTFVVTERCPLACTYCYESHEVHQKTGRRMTKSVAKKAVDMLFDKEKINGYYDLDKMQGVILEFIGGEPLLEIELIDYIVDYFRFKAFEMNHPWAYNYRISITTNGILYKNEKVQEFIEKNREFLSMSITIDGNKQLHDACRVFPDGRGSYDIVEDAVKLWVENDNLPATKLTLAPPNIMYLCESAKHLWDLGIINISSNCVFEKGWKQEHAKIFYNQLKDLADYLLEDNRCSNYCISLFNESIGKRVSSDRNWCGGNGEMIAIGHDGTFFPCLRFMKHSLRKGREEKPMGNLTDGLDRKEENKWLKHLCSITMSSQSTEECLNCKVASGCSLCTAFNYDEFGDPNVRATYICEMHKARVLANVYYWNRLYKKFNLDKTFELNLDDDMALKIICKEELENLKKLVRKDDNND